jgi:hypothetical protein
MCDLQWVDFGKDLELWNIFPCNSIKTTIIPFGAGI